MRRALIQAPQRWRNGTMVGVYYMISLFSSPMSFRGNLSALGLDRLAEPRTNSRAGRLIALVPAMSGPAAGLTIPRKPATLDQSVCESFTRMGYISRLLKMALG